MEQEGLQPDAQTYTSVIDAIARSGRNPEQAQVIVDRMRKAGMSPNVITYNAVINGRFGLDVTFNTPRVNFALMYLTYYLFSA